MNMARTEFHADRYDEAYPPGIERAWWHVARNRVIAHAFARWVPRDARVLEVGCGTGIVTSMLRERGWNVTGVDPGEPRYDLRVREHLLLGTDVLELPQDQRASFTAIALFDVIEHVEDAPAFLRALLTAYPHVRQVVVTVPACAALWTNFDDHYGHFRRYDRPMLRTELASAGLGTERIAYFFHALHPAIVLNNTLRGRERDIRFKAPAPGFSTVMNKAVGAFFALEAHLLPTAWAGSSIIAVASRK